MTEATPLPVTVRPLAATDSFATLTSLLHRSYARLAAMGLNYTATDQTERTTRYRASRGECLIAELEGKIVGTIALHRKDNEIDSTWHRRDDVAILEQFAVEPLLQGKGIGRALIAEAEKRAKAQGAMFAVGDTAETASHLIAMYLARGYARVDTVKWPGKTYRSVVLAKRLR